jgi:hypothetical protein
VSGIKAIRLNAFFLPQTEKFDTKISTNFNWIPTLDSANYSSNSRRLSNKIKGQLLLAFWATSQSRGGLAAFYPMSNNNIVPI